MLAAENSCEPWLLNPGEGLFTTASKGEELPINIDEWKTGKFSFLYEGPSLDSSGSAKF